MSSDPVRSIYDLPVVVPRADVMDLVIDLRDRAQAEAKKAREAAEALEEQARIAQRAIEAINHGASVDELRDRFRDIQTRARRRPK